MGAIQIDSPTIRIISDPTLPGLYVGARARFLCGEVIWIGVMDGRGVGR